MCVGGIGTREEKKVATYNGGTFFVAQARIGIREVGDYGMFVILSFIGEL